MLDLAGNRFGMSFHSHLHKGQNPIGFQPNQVLENAVRRSLLVGNERILLLINIDLLTRP